MIKKILGVVATAALALGATSAQAVPYATTNTYLGVFSAPGDAEFFDHKNISGAFTDTWIFQFNNVLGLQTNVNYLALGTISDFQAELFNVSTATCGAVGTVCSTATVTTSLGVFSPDGDSNYKLLANGLASGYYALVITGTPAPSSTNLYSGQVIATTVPEPTTLGLLGLGLAAVGFVRRRRQVA